ncbi:hypothetical protein ACEPAF_4393 [Sanghuangporus sanghuang]
MQPDQEHFERLQGQNSEGDSRPLVQQGPEEVAVEYIQEEPDRRYYEDERDEREDPYDLQQGLAGMHIGHTPPPERSYVQMEERNIARYVELLQRRRYRHSATRRFVHESLVCTNCYLAYQRSWVLSEWLLKNFVERLVTREGADVKIRHKPGPSTRTFDQPLPNRGMSAYDHEVSVWLGDRDIYALKVGVRAWINQHRHQTLCRNTAVEVDWPIYYRAPSDVESLIEEATDRMLEAWERSEEGVITVDEWRETNHLGRRYRLTSGTGLQFSDIDIAARHRRVSAKFTQPPRLISDDRQGLPIPNPEITVSPMMED